MTTPDITTARCSEFTRKMLDLETSYRDVVLGTSALLLSDLIYEGEVYLGRPLTNTELSKAIDLVRRRYRKSDVIAEAVNDLMLDAIQDATQGVR